MDASASTSVRSTSSAPRRRNAQSRPRNTMSASAWKRLFLGFRVPPVVKWDIELSLFRAHIELPDSIEDDWLASELSSRLAQYTLESPLSVSLMPRNDGKESLTKKLYRLGREEIEEEVMEARELKASGQLPPVKESRRH